MSARHCAAVWAELEAIQEALQMHARPAHWFTAKVEPRPTVLRGVLRWLGFVD